MTTRGDILVRAKELTEGERNQVHGEPEANMECFSRLLMGYFTGLARSSEKFAIGASDAAVILCLHKISRIAANPNHADNYTDLAAYAAIAGECAGVSI